MACGVFEKGDYLDAVCALLSPPQIQRYVLLSLDWKKGKKKNRMRLGVLSLLLLVVTHIQVRGRGGREGGRETGRGRQGMRGGQAGKAGGVAALIYAARRYQRPSALGCFQTITEEQ